MKLLLAANAHVDAAGAMYGTTSLLMASKGGHVEIVRTLLAFNADTEVCRAFGWVDGVPWRRIAGVCGALRRADLVAWQRASGRVKSWHRGGSSGCVASVGGGTGRDGPCSE